MQFPQSFLRSIVLRRELNGERNFISFTVKLDSFERGMIGARGMGSTAEKRRFTDLIWFVAQSVLSASLLLRRRLIYFRLSPVCINHIQTIPCHRKAGGGFERRLWTKKNGRRWRVSFTFRFANCSGVSLSIYHSFVKTHPRSREKDFHHHLLIVLGHPQVS